MRPLSVLQIATLDHEPEMLLAGVRELGVSRMVVLHDVDTREAVPGVIGILRSLQVDTHVIALDGDVVQGAMSAVGAAKRDAAARGLSPQMNASAGPRLLVAAATAAAIVHGVPAFVIVDGRPRFLPTLPFDVNQIVSPSKLLILRAVAQAGAATSSLQALAAETGLEKSLLSYHIRGGAGAKGLEELGLVRIARGARGRLSVSLTPLGEAVAMTPEQGELESGSNGSSVAGDR